VQFGLLVLAGAAVYSRFKREVATEDRARFIALVVVVYVAVLVFKRMTRRKTGGLVRLEVSERELVFREGNGRTEMLWSAFSRCLESPNLFVLVNRPKTILYSVPKRAFPDEAAQNWFRTQASQPQSVAPAATEEPFVPGRFVAASGISLIFQLKYRDYLSRFVTSWRMKGLFVGMLALVTGISLFSTPPPDAVNSPFKVYLIMLSVMVFVISFFSWRGEKKYQAPQQIVLTDEGIEFAGRDSSGSLSWNTYKYYLENRWGFFVWHPRGSLWFMLPKREFPSPSDLAQFRSILRTNLKPSRWFFL
jgi:membrane protein implicated in regulation of membrane protease activity